MAGVLVLAGSLTGCQPAPGWSRLAAPLCSPLTDPEAGPGMSWFEKIMPSRIKTERRTRSVPEGLWIKCPACDSVLYRAELERNLNVCPKCGYSLKDLRSPICPECGTSLRS